MSGVLHVCLAGRLVSQNQKLIGVLRARHQVTLIDELQLLVPNAVLATADVLVLDCSEEKGLVLHMLEDAGRRFPRLRVVLVDGGLSQRDVATALALGAEDYFPEPCDVTLLAQRVEVLGGRVRGPQNR